MNACASVIDEAGVDPQPTIDRSAFILTGEAEIAERELQAIVRLAMDRYADASQSEDDDESSMFDLFMAIKRLLDVARDARTEAHKRMRDALRELEGRVATAPRKPGARP